MVDLIIFAVVAIFILYRLYSVLGSRTGTEKKRSNPFEPFPQSEESSPSNVVDIQSLKKKASSFQPNEIIDVPFELTEKDVKGGQKVIDAFKKKETDFNVSNFLRGAKVAFETILKSYAQADKKTLKPLLSKSIMDLFLSDMEERAKKKQSLDITIKDLTAEIMDARQKGQKIEFDVQFVSEQTHTVKTPNPDDPQEDITSQEAQACVDLWTFEREIGSSSPNWVLIATGEGSLSIPQEDTTDKTPVR